MAEPLGIALAGGGTKGAYEIGAWCALDELGVRYDAVVGTSIGALNGALMALQDLEGAKRIYDNLTVDRFFRLPKDAHLRSANMLTAKNANVLAKEILLHKGVDTSPLRALIEHSVDPARLMASPIDYGLVTYALRQRQALMLFKEDIPPEKLTDYLLASAAYPGLQRIRIDGNTYLDGGLADNLPISMLRARGIRNIIAIDIRSPRSHKKVVTDGITLTHISNRLKLGSAFDLTPETIARNRALGYLDTRKAFSLLQGVYYYFPPVQYRLLCQETEAALLEQAGVIYGLTRTRVYGADDFLHALLARREAVHVLYLQTRGKLSVEAVIALLRRRGQGALSEAQRNVVIVELLLEGNFERLARALPLPAVKRLMRVTNALNALIQTYA
nr:patatin-like phospholipase family protein [Maliibacterium massiliense]